MAKIKGDVIDFTGVETGGGGGARVPENDYLLEVDKVERGVGKESGNSMLIWTFKIAKGKHKGKKLKKVYTVLTVDSLWKLKEVLDALGMGSTKIDLKKVIKRAPGMTCGGTVIDGEEYRGKISSEVAEFMSLETLDGASDDDDDDDEDDTDDDDDSDDDDEEEEKPKKKAKKSSKKKKKSDDDDEDIEDLDLDEL